MLARSGFELGDTSLVVYFNGTDTDSWRVWRATVLDPETGQEQQSQPTSELPRCGEPRRFCHAFGTSAGWTLVAGKRYSVTITVTRQDGGEVVSAPSNEAAARRTAVPPEMPAPQAAGCGCPNALAASVPGQSVRGVGVNTATGAFHWSQQDFQMASFAVPFQVKRTYSSANQGSGTLGKGWAWTYDVRVFPPTGGETSVAVRAEDGAQVTYARNADGSYARPPGVRSTLTSLPDNTWRLTTPGQNAYAFDTSGRVTSITNARRHGVHIGHSAAEWRITDAAGRVVVVSLNAAGLVSRITLPDGRKTQYSYEDGRLSAVQDAQGNTWSHVYAGGVLVKVVDPRGHAQITNEYAAGRVVAQSAADGARTTFEWDAARQESKVTDPDGVVVFDGYRGNVQVYTQNGNGDAVNTRYSAALDPSLTVDARGNQRERGFDPAGNRTSATAPEPFSFTERTSYDGRNNPTSLTNGEGHTTTFGHSPYDEVEQETAASGDKTTYQRDSRGLVTRMTDARGKVTTFGYDQAGNMVARTSPSGARTTYSYDKTGRRLSETKPRGNVPGANPHDFTTKYGYDALDRIRTVQSPGHERAQENVYDNVGQLVRSIDPLERTTLYTYAKVLNRRISVIDPRGSVTKTGYSPAGREISRVDAEGNRATYTYDHRGQLATTVSPRGNAPGADPAQFTTRYFYDNNGNLVRTSRPYPGGGSADVDSGFDALDRRETATDEFGNQSTIRHDNTDSVTSTVDPLGNRTDIDYDANGRPSAVRTAGGGESKVVYDPVGNPLRKVSMTGGATTWSYDDDGRVVTKTDPRGNAPGADPSAFAVRYGYDVDGNLVATADPLGNTTRFEYDANGRVTSSTDANNHTTRYQYDDASQLVAVTGPDGHDPTRYGYGADGSVVSRKDPLGRKTEYRHDRLGQLVSVTDPLERTRVFGYDEERNLVRTVNAGRGDAKARTTIETFDSLNRRVRRQLGVDGPVYTYGFDARNRPTSVADPAGVRVQEFDKRDRLTKVTRGDQVYGYTYDQDGNVATRTWPDGTTVSSGFDKAGRLTRLTASGGRAGTTPVTYDFEYDPSGRLRRTTAPGLVTERAYDNAGRLVDMNTHGVAAYQITRDPAGNPTRIITTRGDASETSGYFYDEADRVIAACYGGAGLLGGQPGCDPSATGTARFGYDTVGNRVSQVKTGTTGASTTRYGYDDADQLVEEKTGNTSRTFAYDDEGNQIRAGKDTFRYNLDHTLASATVAGRTTDFRYDGDALRIASGDRAWSWDVNGDRPWLTSDSTRGYLPAPGHGALATLDNGVGSYAPDWLGGVAAVLSPAGAVTEKYDYGAFGEPRSNGTAGGPGGTNPLRFTGAYADPALDGRYSLPARVYDSSTGRFGGIDPEPSSLRQPATSTYAYALNRPTMLIDPTGGAPIADGGGSVTDPEPLPPSADAGQWDKAPWEVPCRLSQSEYCQILMYIHSEMVTNAQSQVVRGIKQNLEFSRSQSPWWEFWVTKNDQLEAKAAAEFSWGLKVCQKLCPWDHKPKIREKWGMSEDDPDSLYSDVPGKPYRIFYDVWSNIHYGYVGIQAAFTGQRLQEGAGGGGPAGGNDEGDVITVQIGIDLGGRYTPDKLAPDHIDYGIRARLTELFLLKPVPDAAKHVVPRK